jgi:signal peptidase
MTRKRVKALAKLTIGDRIWLVIILILCLLFGLLMAGNVANMIQLRRDPKLPASIGDITPLTVHSYSMSGTEPGHLEEGDLVFIRKTDARSLKEGDVIAFLQNDAISIHRVVKIAAQEDGSFLYTTKGDANVAEDTEPVRESDVLGICAGRIPQLGRIVRFAQTPIGAMLCVAIPLLLGFIYDGNRRRKNALQISRKTARMEFEISERERKKKLSN